MSYGINDPSQIPAHLLADPENAEVVRGYRLSVERGKQRMMEVVGEIQDAQMRAAAPASPGRKQKYNAQPTEVDGEKFASKAEARRYQELRDMERAGLVRNLKTQPEFTLQEAFADGWGVKHRAVRYVADFVYIRVGDSEDYMVVEDVKGGKGTQTPQFRIKWKWAIKLNPQFKFELVGG